MSIPLLDPLHSWALAATPRTDGAVDIAVSLFGDTSTKTACITVSRDEARDFARAVLRAAGDGAERTHRTQVEAAHG
ncbi:MAG: hypothetical protein K2X91_12825 [Thermoleophilia bacterium]|nr:hypothetical protein [Thermoleophilia bacterium]